MAKCIQKLHPEGQLLLTMVVSGRSANSIWPDLSIFSREAEFRFFCVTSKFLNITN